MNIAYTTEDIVSHGMGYQLTAGRAGTSVTSLLGLLVATLAEVISAGVDDQSALFNVRDDHDVDRVYHRGKNLRQERSQHQSASQACPAWSQRRYPRHRS